ncbi:MAG: hypothetical protein ABFD20_11245 [Anaerolineales bacterium]
MSRQSKKRNQIIVWVLSVLVALSMTCGFITYLVPAREARTPTPTPTPTIVLTPTPAD